MCLQLMRAHLCTDLQEIWSNPTFFLDKFFFRPKFLFDPKSFLPKYSFGPIFFFAKNFFSDPKFSRVQNFVGTQKFFLQPKIFLGIRFLSGPKFCWDPKFSNQRFFSNPKFYPSQWTWGFLNWSLTVKTKSCYYFHRRRIWKTNILYLITTPQQPIWDTSHFYVMNLYSGIFIMGTPKKNSLQNFFTFRQPRLGAFHVASFNVLLECFYSIKAIKENLLG